MMEWSGWRKGSPGTLPGLPGITSDVDIGRDSDVDDLAALDGDDERHAQERFDVDVFAGRDGPTEQARQDASAGVLLGRHGPGDGAEATAFLRTMRHLEHPADPFLQLL